ncbi:type 1 glutamine amidotransferase [Candidatus Woesearchaeota archaeon]|nr:type 1 glutamine amidotransferase [Candidatus Woesearchaeota archaeon]
MKIAVLLTDDFQDDEYVKPVEAFKKAGHEIINLELKRGRVVKGKKGVVSVTIDESITRVYVEDFDALLIPGGYSPDKLRINDDVVKFVKDFFESGKPVFVICHGQQLLINADVLKGKKITGYRSIIQDLKNAGAEFIDAEVVVDNNLVSSRQPKDLPAFIKACLNKLKSI